MTLEDDATTIAPLRIKHLHRHGHMVLQLVGDLRRDTAADAGRAITTALLNAGSVLVDLDGVQIEHASRSLVFTAALDQAGGWPQARLVLYGGSPELVSALDHFRVTRTVPHVPTLPEALIKIAMRPTRVRRGVTLEPQLDAPRRARALLHEASAAWGIPAANAGKARAVLGDLVASAVEGAKTCRAVVEFDGTRVWVSVSDRCAGIPRMRPRDLWAGGAPREAILLADQWGVEYLRHTQKVWAVITGGSRHSAGSAG